MCLLRNAHVGDLRGWDPRCSRLSRTAATRAGRHALLSPRSSLDQTSVHTQLPRVSLFDTPFHFFLCPRTHTHTDAHSHGRTWTHTAPPDRREIVKNSFSFAFLMQRRLVQSPRIPPNVLYTSSSLLTAARRSPVMPPRDLPRRSHEAGRVRLRGFLPLGTPPEEMPRDRRPRGCPSAGQWPWRTEGVCVSEAADALLSKRLP